MVQYRNSINRYTRGYQGTRYYVRVAYCSIKAIDYSHCTSTIKVSTAKSAQALLLPYA